MSVIPRFVYLDTNIISHLAKNKELWPKLSEFLILNDLVLGISSANISELSEATNLHPTLAEMLVQLPSATLKEADTILEEEVKSHHYKRVESLLAYPLNYLLSETGGVHEFKEFLSSNKLNSARKDQLNKSKQMLTRLTELKANFPPSKTGRYIRDQVEEFACMQVIQWLGIKHQVFLKSLQTNIENFHSEIFLSILLFAHVIFYKYYLGKREPKISDFVDLEHLFVIPYCELAIMERDLCNVLNQIKRSHNSLDSTVVKNIDFFKDWKY
ncbi:MAG: hypothetical protein MUO40_12545 [Anaerolineaceae bacterium]|nr:hypothetical protein [Anaerolineaceae bacterium]